MRLRASIVHVILVPAIGLSSGCGSGITEPPDFGSEDGLKIASLMGELVEVSSSKEAGAVFARGAVPKGQTLRRYTRYDYDLDGKPAIRGDTATATVSIRQHDGKGMGTREWSFVKEGGEWKLKSAPLP